MSYTHAQIFGVGSSWQNSGFTLTEPSLVIPLSALAATYPNQPTYENAASETGVATLHRILNGPARQNATQGAYDADLTRNLIVRPPAFDSFATVEHTVGTTTNVETAQTLQVQFFKLFDTNIDSNDF